MLITNRMRRPFIVPRIKDNKGNLSGVITIMGGKSVEVDDKLWKAASNNKAIRALINQRCLDVKAGHSNAETVEDDELENAEPKKSPEDLSSDQDDERLDTTSTTTSVDAPNDAPAGGKKKKPGRPKKAKA